MCDPVTLTIAGAGLTAGPGIYSAYNQYQQGLAQNSYYQKQAELSRAEGQRALDAADKQSTYVQDTAKEEGKRLKTSQAEFNAATRAQLAANGIVGVTAEDITSNNFNKELMDEAAVRYNADVKSWEINSNAQNQNWAANIQATNYDYAGKSAKYAGKTEAIGTLLSTAVSVASQLGGSGLLKPKTTFSTGGSFSNTSSFKMPNTAKLR